MADTIIPFLGVEDLQEKGPISMVAALFAEFLGTLFIILLGCGSALNFSTTTDLVQIRYKNCQAKKVAGI